MPDVFAIVHAPLVRVAHVVVGSRMLGVQILPEEVISYFYCTGFGAKRRRRRGNNQLWRGVLGLSDEKTRKFLVPRIDIPVYLLGSV